MLCLGYVCGQSAGVVGEVATQVAATVFHKTVMSCLKNMRFAHACMPSVRKRLLPTLWRVNAQGNKCLVVVF